MFPLFFEIYSEIKQPECSMNDTQKLDKSKNCSSVEELKEQG